MEREKTELEKFIEALPHHDTVVCRLTGVGETEFSTEKLYNEIMKIMKK